MRGVFLCGVLFVTFLATPVHAQTVLNCGEERLSVGEKLIFETPSLLQIQNEIEELTRQALSELRGQNRDAIADTEGPFIVDRNACQNDAARIRTCVESNLRHRRDALILALRSPETSREELAHYASLDVGFFEK